MAMVLDIQTKLSFPNHGSKLLVAFTQWTLSEDMLHHNIMTDSLK